MGEIIFNGHSSKEVGLEVETFPSYQAPRRSYEKVHIPGRNGDFLIDTGCWENVVREYSVSVGSLERSYYDMMNKVTEWLHSTISYARLEDSYEPDIYRLAVYLEEITITNLFNQGGKATIQFDCKPQRFLKTGDEPITITAKSSIIQNPTSFASLPIIHVYGTGNGTLVIGDNTITITEIGSNLIIDSDVQDVYYNTENKNSVIKLPNGFPTFDPGLVKIGFSGGITKLEVIPKWYTL